MADVSYTTQKVFSANTFVRNGKTTMTCVFAVGGRVEVEVRHSKTPEFWVLDGAEYSPSVGQVYILDTPGDAPIRVTPFGVGTSFNMHGVESNG